MVPQLAGFSASSLFEVLLVRHVVGSQVEVQVTSPGRNVSLAAELQGGRLILRVQDQGPGFPEHLRPGLFLPCRSTASSIA